MKSKQKSRTIIDEIDARIEYWLSIRDNANNQIARLTQTKMRENNRLTSDTFISDENRDDYMLTKSEIERSIDRAISRLDYAVMISDNDHIIVKNYQGERFKISIRKMSQFED